MFSSEFREISKNTFFTEHIRTTASHHWFDRSETDICRSRSNRLDMFFKKGILEKFSVFTGKHLHRTFLNKFAGLKACNFLKKRLQYRRLWLLLKIKSRIWSIIACWSLLFGGKQCLFIWSSYWFLWVVNKTDIFMDVLLVVLISMHLGLIEWVLMLSKGFLIPSWRRCFPY